MFEIVVPIVIGLIVGWACATLPAKLAKCAAKNDISFIKRILGIKSPSKAMLGKEECESPCRECNCSASNNSGETDCECYFCHRVGCNSHVRWGFRVVPICVNCLEEIPNEINTIEP